MQLPWPNRLAFCPASFTAHWALTCPSLLISPQLMPSKKPPTVYAHGIKHGSNSMWASVEQPKRSSARPRSSYRALASLPLAPVRQPRGNTATPCSSPKCPQRFSASALVFEREVHGQQPGKSGGKGYASGAVLCRSFVEWGALAHDDAEPAFSVLDHSVHLLVVGAGEEGLVDDDRLVASGGLGASIVGAYFALANEGSESQLEGWPNWLESGSQFGSLWLSPVAAPGSAPRSSRACDLRKCVAPSAG